MNAPFRATQSRRLPRSKSLSIVGAGLGVLAFLGVAMLPSLIYGGAAGVQLVDGVFGSHSGHALRTDAFILGGILAAVTAVGFLFVVFGAVVGASVGALTCAAVPEPAAAPARDSLRLSTDEWQVVVAALALGSDTPAAEADAILPELSHCSEPLAA